MINITERCRIARLLTSYSSCCVKKNLNSSKTAEHPPSKGGEMSVDVGQSFNIRVWVYFMLGLM